MSSGNTAKGSGAGGAAHTKEFVKIGELRAPIHSSEHPELIPVGFGWSHLPEFKMFSYIIKTNVLKVSIFCYLKN